MDHQHPAAQPVGAQLEAGAVARERIHPGRPRPGGRGRRPDELPPVRSGRQLDDMPLTEVQDHLEHPGVGGQRSRIEHRAVRGDHGGPIAVPDPAQVAAGTPGPPRLGDRAGGNAAVVLGDMVVDNRLARVAYRVRHEPAEDPQRIGRVGHPAARIPAVDRRRVVRGGGAPVHVGGVVGPGPPLDAGVTAVGTRPEAPYPVTLAHLLHHGAGVVHDRHQVLAVEDEGVAVHLRAVTVAVAGQAPIGPPADRRHRQVPAQPERPVAGAGVVAQRQGGSAAGPPRAGRDRDRRRAGAGGRVRGERLTDPADRPAPARQADRRRPRSRRGRRGVVGRGCSGQGSPPGNLGAHHIPAKIALIAPFRVGQSVSQSYGKDQVTSVDGKAILKRSEAIRCTFCAGAQLRVYPLDLQFIAELPSINDQRARKLLGVRAAACRIFESDHISLDQNLAPVNLVLSDGEEIIGPALCCQ